jgi:hypothetical protein
VYAVTLIFSIPINGQEWESRHGLLCNASPIRRRAARIVDFSPSNVATQQRVARNDSATPSVFDLHRPRQRKAAVTAGATLSRGRGHPSYFSA